MADLHNPHIHEYPWHRRVATTEHQVRFRKLADLQNLTHAWLEDLQVDRSTHLMNRGLSPEISKNLWLLNSLSDQNPDSLLEEAYPSEMLIQLSELVYAVQAWTLQTLLSRTPEEGRAVLLSVLEQSSWKTGRAYAQKRWAESQSESKSELLVRLSCAPIYSASGPDNFLVRRCTSDQVQIELLTCPHRLEYDEVVPSQDLMCRLHSHWARGYFYALNPKMSLEYRAGSPRCRLDW